MRKTVLIALVSGCVGCFATYAVAEPQPHMRKALNNLEEALVQLKSASHDKGGHRVKAIEHVEAAIAEVRAGIDFDNKH